MGRSFENRSEAEVPATPDEVWAAIASGPGIDSWFMGRSEVQPGADGTVRTVFGEYAPELDVTAWDPGRRFAYRSGEAPDGRFIAYEFLIEGRAGGSTVLRTVTSGFLPGDDWAGEFEAMNLGGEMYFRTLVEYLAHFAGRFAAAVTAFGPPGTTWTRDRALVCRALGLSDEPQPGDRARLTADRIGSVDGVLYFANAHTIGVRTQYDRRGRGASGDTLPYTPDREVDDIEALAAAAGGTLFVHGTSSGAALALEAAKRVPAITKLALYEPPFIVDGTRSPIPDGYLTELTRLIADGRRGDAVKMFMRFVGTPAIFTAIMPFTPAWPKLKAVAPTLPYDIAIMQDHQRGTPFTTDEWAAVKIPALVAVGGKSPAWMTSATRALAGALPDARHQTLPGQNHMVTPQAIAPALTEFFRSDT